MSEPTSADPLNMPDWYEPPTAEDWNAWYEYLDKAGLDLSGVPAD